MPTEIYIAFLAASSCIVVLTVLLIVAAVYFRARVKSMERQVARLEGDLAGLIDESRGLIRATQRAAVLATGAMDDVGVMTHTVAGWTVRADRMIENVVSITESPKNHVSEYLRFGGGFAMGVMQVLLAPGRKY